MKPSQVTIAIRATVEFMKLIPGLASSQLKKLWESAVSGQGLAILPVSS